MSDKVGKESQYMVSHPELGSDRPIGSDRESGCDTLPLGVFQNSPNSSLDAKL